MSLTKIMHIMTVLIILFAIITSSVGLFYSTNGQAYDFINQYGDIVKIYGNGLYKHDSYFMAPIFKGTDCAILFFVVPLSIITLIYDIKKNSIKTKLFLTGLIALFVYYSASISFGIVYNFLHLVYIALFGFSFFTLIIGFMVLKTYNINKQINIKTNGLMIFMLFCGISLFIAWLPDILSSLFNNKSLDLIEVYTIQITYVLDMGIISPLIFICIYNLWKNNDLGYILLGIILMVLTIIAVILPLQSIFQINAGIIIPIEALITKVGIFVALAIIAIYYNFKLFKNI